MHLIVADGKPAIAANLFGAIPLSSHSAKIRFVIASSNFIGQPKKISLTVYQRKLKNMRDISLFCAIMEPLRGAVVLHAEAALSPVREFPPEINLLFCAGEL